MRYISRISILIAFLGLYGCHTASQVAVTTSTSTIDVSETPTSIPTIQVTATNTSPPTATATNTPLFYSTPFILPSELITAENIHDLRELAVFGKGTVNNFSYSPDGELLAVATMRGIYLYDAFTFVEKKHITTDDSANSVAFSPDGAILAVTFARGSVQLWDVSSSNLLDTLEQNTGRAGGSVLFSPDGSFLFSGSGDAVIRMWQISDGKLIRTFRGSHEYYNHEMTNSMSISPDGSLLVTTDGYEKIWIWRVTTGELVHTLEGNRVAFSPDGKVLAVGKGYYSDDLVVMFWRVFDWTLINSFEGHRGVFLSMTFSPDGTMILINDSWRQAKLWDISNQSVSECFQCGERHFDVLLFSPDGSTLTTLDWNGVLQVWNILDGMLLHSFNEHLGTVTSVTFSPDGRFLASNSPSTVSVWRLSDSTLASNATYKEYNDLSPLRMAFSPGNKFLAFGPFLGGLRLWAFDSANQALVFRDGQTIRSLALSPDGTICAIGIDNTIEFRVFPDGELFDTLNLDSFQDAEELAYSPDGNFLAIGRYGKVEIWYLPDKSLVHTLNGIGYSINRVAFSSDGNIFATGTLNTAQWDGKNGRQLQSLPVRGHIFSPDLSMIVALENKEVQFYRMTDGKFIGNLKFDFYIRDVAFSLDEKLIALAGVDGTVSIWGIP